ncbi:Gfo/Idh/MocA family protein [Paenibacillus sacheonensis]|uniref:Gfo/Idh/MocA family oxidoreductase n=1 Tax=Paenibacillus sacheonensis TaxID=742054 RepID=A0A7X4YNI1_9BACL|nr:Gfo/Idh/MocA family oxidoreductase [Paenibacillus sacheonensis]MBM7565492.1 putative dehydrogenase [Paenibacillus sacheonensis]NBC69580.1 Gfo/Idh/MocA family oxidoreductase [Paenibacillus sacheonensis]
MIRFGIIGSNFITDQFVAAVREVEGVALSALYSRTAERAEEYASKNGIPLTFTDIGEMAASGEVDAVYIASPTSFHAEQAILCMREGKHVLCEKPAASNARELQRMIETAKENGVVFMEAMKSSFMPGFQAIRELLPSLGTIRRYTASYCQYSSRYDAFRAGNVLNAFKPEFSNGALMDLGVYCVYPLVLLFGAPERISASGTMLSSGVDGQGSIIAGYKDMEAIITYSKISNSSLPAEIQGEEGTMIIDAINLPRQITVRYRDGRVKEASAPEQGLVMSYEVRAFAELIQEGVQESPLNSHANALAVMNVLDEARRLQGLVFPADLK